MDVEIDSNISFNIFFKKKTNKDSYCKCHEKNHKEEKKGRLNIGIFGLFARK
jgi:hypothetical protein